MHKSKKYIYIYYFFVVVVVVFTYIKCLELVPKHMRRTVFSIF